MWTRIIFVAVLFFLIDLYFFQAVKTVTQGFTVNKKSLTYCAFWSLTALSIGFGVAFNYLPSTGPWKGVRLYGMSILMMFMICKVLGVLPLLIDDIVRFFKLIVQLFIREHGVDAGGKGISRAKFLSQMAMVVAAIPLATFLFGMMRGAFNYQIRKVSIKLPNLPESFKGFKIVQISDLHIGSFVSDSPLNTAFSMIADQKPDVILFTGDLVNNRADEAEEFVEQLSSLSAPEGVFSVLGNHDYGHYVKWKNDSERIANVEKLKLLQKDVGWKLLMNESHIFEKNGEKLALIGIENWSSKMNFPKYGQLAKAHAEAADVPCKILMSHDPSHWEAETTEQFKDISLTLSGHTHGMQFGIEIPGLKWSPIQYVYKQWAGLYQKGDQYLYVNRGLGFIGYMGRVGIMPEITVVELDRA
ncbi:MAG TPA: metallophosphoesterase [Flavobacteriales bacterium]|nr:metallophosphoesterase [Flavobacteriales bacterium]HIA12168.1 metallophosphoesterase [Flavobacteriales bacterium]